MIGLASGPLNPFSDERSRSFYIVRIVRAEADYRGSLSTLRAELSEPIRMRDQSKSGRNGRLIRHSPDVLVQQGCYKRVIGAFNSYESDWTSFPYLYAEDLLIAIRNEISP